MFPDIITEKKSWEESFLQNGKNLNFKVKDFWGRGFSQLVTNNLRGILAEYIVASDIGITQTPREEWDAYDLITDDKIKIEIKSVSYLQSWKQEKFSSISFSIRPTYGYDPETNERDQELKRQSDIYIFCLLAHKDQATLNPLDLDQWIFYLAPTKLLNKKVGNQKNISLKKLQEIWAQKTSYWKIYPTIKKILEE